jgi:HPt (histidine-containing phosphotransfer) domain-containing protein
MSKSVPSHLFHGEAYRLFVGELELRLQQLSRLLSEVPDSSECAQLSADFHRLKGGAGFFGFDQICRIAGELEVLFTSQSDHSPIAPEIQQALAALKTCRSQIPQPERGNHA